MKGIKLGICTLVLAFAVCSLAQAQDLYGLAGDGPNSLSDLYKIDTTTGAATLVGNTGFQRCGGMDYDVQTKMLIATCERNDGSNPGVLVSIDRSTGQGTEIGPLGGSCDVATDISFRNSDNVLFAGLHGECPFSLATINVDTGSANILGSFGSFPAGNGMAFSMNDTLYLANDAVIAIIDQSNGSVISSIDLNYPSVGDTPRINAMDLNPGTNVMFASVVSGGPEFSTPRANFIATVDPGSANVTIIGSTQDGLDAIAFVGEPVVVNPIPTLSEKGLIAMAIILLASALFLLRRRQIA